jgi:GT2 family glycosyltransferase
MRLPLRISAIVSSYNRPDLLRRALLSLACQTRLIDEVVISDDGSQVDVPAQIGDHLGELPFPVTFVWQPHQGFRLAKCRNNGIRAACGDYLVFADQDLVFLPGYVEILARCARRGEFLVGYPVRLDEPTSARLTDRMIRDGTGAALVTDAGARKVRRQYRKEQLYRLLHAMGLRPMGPKVRGGIFAAHRADVLRINGFDEEYQAWGSEDDNIGRRLYQTGVRGRNPFRDTHALHLYHPPHAATGERANQALHARRVAEVRQGVVRAAHGVDDPLGGDESRVTVLHTP